MNKTLLITIVLALFFAACKKDNDTGKEKDPTQKEPDKEDPQDNRLKFNPDNCKKITFRDNDGNITIIQFWTGESLDSTHNYLNGVLYTKGYTEGYMTGYQKTWSINVATGEKGDTYETWSKGLLRAERTRITAPDGTVKSESFANYSCE
ncbi:MAG: hypothetical protein M9892_04525 [Bacteroidetes bacterium]|nr:hypothetical protein [Bacteroidota bacterium]